MLPRWDVLGIGAVAVDDLIYLDGFPAPGSKLYIASEQRQGGGLAGAALVAAARLGVRAAFMGVLDDDDLSRYTLAQLETEGVDCSPVRREAGARPFHSTILVDQQTGERTILASNAGVTPPQAEEMTHALPKTTVRCATTRLAVYRWRIPPAAAMCFTARMRRRWREAVISLAPSQLPRWQPGLRPRSREGVTASPTGPSLRSM